VLTAFPQAAAVVFLPGLPNELFEAAEFSDLAFGLFSEQQELAAIR
jgi:hypothetical protein